MNISMNEEQMTVLVSKAILDGMTPDAKDEMLQKALRHLMTKEKPSYGYGPARSPLEQAYQDGAYSVAQKIVREKLEGDEAFKANLEALFVDLGKKLFEGPLREKLVQQMADAVVSGLRAD